MPRPARSEAGRPGQAQAGENWDSGEESESDSDADRWTDSDRDSQDEAESEPAAERKAGAAAGAIPKVPLHPPPALLPAGQARLPHLLRLQTARLLLSQTRVTAVVVPETLGSLPLVRPQADLLLLLPLSPRRTENGPHGELPLRPRPRANGSLPAVPAVRQAACHRQLHVVQRLRTAFLPHTRWRQQEEACGCV